MTPSYRVAIADHQPQGLSLLREYVKRAAHEVVIEAESGEALIELCRHDSPDLVITDIELPGIELLEEWTRQSKNATPLIVLSSTCTQASIDHANEIGAYAYLAKPIEASTLQAAILLSVRLFEELRASRNDADNARQALQDRKTIERAKGVVMQRLGIDEPAAFRHLQNLARRTRKSLPHLAGSILLSEQALSV